MKKILKKRISLGWLFSLMLAWIVFLVLLINFDNQQYQILGRSGDGSGSEVVTATDDDTNLDDKRGLVSNSILYGRINDSTVVPLRVDGSTHSIQFIDYEHHEIHSGSHFFVCGTSTIDSGATVDFQVTTPDTDKWTHMTFQVEGTDQTSITIYEGATVSGDGDAVTAYNNNRNLTATSTLTLDMDGTVTASGTVIYSQIFGVNGTFFSSSQTGIDSRDREIILKQNTTYRFVIESFNNGNDVSYCGEWYEHTDKN